jgi:hypothetical protein
MPSIGCSHDRWHRDTKHSQRANQLTPDHGYSGEKEVPPSLVGFIQDTMTVVERMKQLGQLERMFGEIRWFGSGDALIHDV